VSGIARDTLIDGRYKVVSRLGTGGMADVFLVEDQLLGRKVALKLLHRRFAEDPAFVERFRREAQAAAGLQHQNIVGIYDRGEYDGTYYIAMEYVPGQTLKEVIQRQAPLEPVRAIDLAIQILKAARFAHRRGIVHRDLKPHNVILDDSGDAKVTDFGIARAGASDMTETGSIMGTAQYLSPEQAQGRSVTASSDLYSVAVVLYEMLTGRVPFDGEQAVTIALKHVSEAPAAPHVLNPSIPPELEQTILWTLNKNPADRPVDADQLITVLEHCRDAILAGAAGEHTAAMSAVAAGAAAGMPIEGLPELPPPVEAPGANGPFAARGGGSGQIPVVVADDEPAGRGGGWRPWLLGLLVLLLVVAAAAVAYFLSRPKQVLVPVVTKQQYASARTRLSNAGFTVSEVPKSSSETSGTVISESPKGNSKADEGSSVTLVVSTGQGNVVIPSVQGEPRAKAVATLQSFGLTVGRIVAQPSSRFSTGDATGTNPGAANSVPRSVKITLFVSSGVPAQQVPAVTDGTKAAARDTLTGDGFRVKVEYEVSTTQTPGQVISQTPSSGTEQAAHSVVTIVVAKAPAMVTVPPVVGDRAAEAFGALDAEGFAVNRTFREVTHPNRAGSVVSQSPGGGAKRAKGSAVSIVIGIYHGSTIPPPASVSSSSSGSATTPTSPSSTSSSGSTTGSSTSATATTP
jgi:beta-lactam-binding protein with PASTA domain/predicted Ser/Thr protein kinase